MGTSDSRDLRYIQKHENNTHVHKETCAICLEPMTNHIVWLPCAHSYHNKCLLLWENKCKEKNREITCCLCDLKY